MSDKVRGSLGGISYYAACFFAAIIALALDHRGTQLVEMSMNLSTGAIVGILSCILTIDISTLSIKVIGKAQSHGCLFGLLFPFTISVLDIYSLENDDNWLIQLLSNKLLEAEHHEININEIFCGGICSIIKLYCICNTTLERIWRYICNVSGSIFSVDVYYRYAIW
ncbi:DUF3147 family protein [Staphylococcus aureus]